VTAACLADRGHQVVGFDHDAAAVDRIREGQLPISEPGLADLVSRNVAEGRLEFSSEVRAVTGAEVVWVAYDTPVDDDDHADVGFVVESVERSFPHLSLGSIVLVSSQVPVGTTARLEARLRETRPADGIAFAYSAENLRLGNAIAAFSQPDRIIVGVRDERGRTSISRLLAPLTDRIEWMSVESAEMTKHALNAFLAVSVTFANEIAALCEKVGANAKEVERGLKTEGRIGPRAYLAPGSAFAGGTLARDVEFLSDLGHEHTLALPLIDGVRPSNQWHKGWPGRRLKERLGPLRGMNVAVWGLTYKPGTDTLRRSAAVEVCQWLSAEGAVVRAYDPAVRALPAELSEHMTLQETPEDALRGASALILATEWPEFRSIALADALTSMKRRLIIDANRFLGDGIAGLEVEYLTVGAPVLATSRRG
jgi:UDPglucose 6-dehydrogenase